MNRHKRKIMKTDKSILDYHCLLCEIESKILTGELEKDRKLPSIRELAIKRHLSCATVQKTYMQLKKSKYIRAIPGAGYYVLPNKQLNSKDIDLIRQCIELIKQISLSYDLPVDDIIRFAQSTKKDN